MNSADVVAGTDGTALAFNNLRKDVRNAIKDPQTDNSGAFDLSTSAAQDRTLDGTNGTLSLSNETVGQYFIITLIQDATGSRTVTWFSTIKWPGSVTPTLSTTASKRDVFGFRVTSAGNYDGFIVGQGL
jgi:hypothetical protein